MAQNDVLLKKREKATTEKNAADVELRPPAPTEEQEKQKEAEITKELAETAQATTHTETPSHIPPPPSSVSEQSAPQKPLKSEARMLVEHILSEDINDLYTNMNQEQKVRFKKRGKEIASTIETLINTARLTLKKAVDLIRSWLRLIPGVNRFFLEQEIKIKADKLIQLTKPKKEDAD